MWKKLRILILLLILLAVALSAYRDQNQNWDRPVVVLLHPINAQQSNITEQYIQQLSARDFDEIKAYLTDEAQKYRSTAPVFYFELGRQLDQLPPQVPEDSSLLKAMIWSLKFRYYAWQQHKRSDPYANVTLFLNYYDPNESHTLKHSTALEKGRIGSVNLFASQSYAAKNQVVLTHELMHAFGAQDKYDLQNGQPLYPLGYALPQQQPLYPQRKAELMGGVIPMTETTNRMPEHLGETQMNEATALELGWLK